MKHSLLILNRRDVARTVTTGLAIKVVRDCFKAFAKNQTVMPSKVYLSLPAGDFRAMPAFVKPSSCGLKWVNVHPNNFKRKLPSVMAMILVNDPSNGVPLAVLEGGLITKLRTAAAGAVAAQALARKESKKAALIGCGAQAIPQIEALATLFRLKQVSVWGYRAEEASRLCKHLGRKFSRIAFKPFSSIERCVQDADIVVTITPSRHPLIKKAWIKPGTHINAVGADAPGKQELDARILSDAVVVVDEYDQAIHGGELNVPVSRGQFKPSQIHASLGEILIGRRTGRKNTREITVFDSTGLAIHDVALASAAVELAKKKKLGRRIAWFL